METGKTIILLFYFSIAVSGEGKLIFLSTSCFCKLHLTSVTFSVLEYLPRRTFPSFLGSISNWYERRSDKRLTNVIKTVMTSSAFHCTTWCSMTDGCLAVNVIGNHDITCELTEGLSNETEMIHVPDSNLLVMGTLFSKQLGFHSLLFFLVFSTRSFYKVLYQFYVLS